MKSLHAFHISESIDLKSLRNSYSGDTIYASSTELLFKTKTAEYLYVTNYGVVAFSDMNEVQMSEALGYVKKFTENPFNERYTEQFRINENEQLEFEFDHLNVPKINEQTLHVTFFNMAQSLALDFYQNVAEKILRTIKNFTKDLEEKGKLCIKKKDMLKFVGHSLNMKNAVTENLYIFDSPQIVWEDEYLDQIHIGLVRSFDPRLRFREVENTFGVIDDNLRTFHEVLQHKESAMLEWIIIILILIEVVDMFIHKILNLFPG